MISRFTTIESRELINKIIEIDDWLNSTKLVCTKTDGTQYDFNKFMLPFKFTLNIYSRNLTLKKADDQQELKILINKLNNNYNPTKKNKNRRKN